MHPQDLLLRSPLYHATSHLGQAGGDVLPYALTEAGGYDRSCNIEDYTIWRLA